MNSKRLWLTIGAVVLTASLFCSAQGQDRTWTDKTGKFTVEATLLDYDGTEVKLRKPDGKVVTLAVDKLSKADAIYLKQLDEPSGGDNPFAGGTNDNTTASVRTDSKPQKLNLRGAHTPASGVSDGEWKVAQDAFDPPLFGSPTKAISYNVGKHEFGNFVHQQPFFFSAPAAGKMFTAVGVTNHKNLPQSGTGFIGDTKTGRTVSFPMAFLGLPLGISPSGTRIAVRREEHNPERGGNNWGKRGCVEVMEVVDGKKPQLLASYLPFEEDRPARGIVGPLEVDIEEGDFIDEDHLFVRSARGRLVLFDVNDGSVVWTQRLEEWSGTSVVLTPGKKYALVSATKRTLLVEMLTGDVVAELTGDDDPGGSFAFSPTGTKFAKWLNHKISVWDFATGEKTLTLTHPEGGKVQWLSDEYLLAGSDVIDLQLQCAVWSYNRQVTANEKSCGGGFWCVLVSGDTHEITPMKLPRPVDIEAFSKIPESQRFLVTRGTPVALVLDSSISQNRDKIEADLKKKLEGFGWKVEPGAAIQLRLSIKSGEEKEVNYRGIGTAKYTPHTSSITLEHQGKSVWASRYTSGPSFMISTSSLKDKSLQDFVSEMAAPNYDWFTRTGIPDRIVNPAAKGTTKITARGFE